MPLKESRKGKEKGKECTRKQKVYDSTTSSTKPAGAESLQRDSTDSNNNVKL
jgi:hypothetical protein